MQYPADAAPGFFGKVTTHGDFVSRRLPPAFLSVWDSWLQHALQQSREQLGEGWLAVYLSSPIWRFALAPDTCGGAGWAGILMPSVDRVGRHFPLTVAAVLPPVTGLPDWIAGSQPWFDDLEELALSSLDPGFSLETFDARLAGMQTAHRPSVQALASSGIYRRPQGVCVPLADITRAGSAAAGFMQDAGLASLDGHSLWWTDGSPRVDPCLLVSPSLPLHAAYASMLDGEWVQRGWQVL